MDQLKNSKPFGSYGTGKEDSVKKAQYPGNKPGEGQKEGAGKKSLLSRRKLLQGIDRILHEVSWKRELL